MNEFAPDKTKEKVQTMFNEIAPTYDRLNHLFTLKLDTKWRRDIAEQLVKTKTPVNKILDLASGTGDLTIQLLKLNPEKIIAADISVKMLEIQKKKIADKRLETVLADALHLPFENNTFDIVTIGFGIRNFENLEDSLLEIKRVLTGNGRLVVLEMFKTNNIRSKIFNLYFGKIIPFVGNKISKSKYAYSYLFKSVNSFLTKDEFIGMCEKLGYSCIQQKNNFLGIVNTVYFIKI